MRWHRLSILLVYTFMWMWMSIKETMHNRLSHHKSLFARAQKDMLDEDQREQGFFLVQPHGSMETV